jgi:hypothetical protein
MDRVKYSWILTVFYLPPSCQCNNNGNWLPRIKAASVFGSGFSPGKLVGLLQIRQSFSIRAINRTLLTTIIWWILGGKSTD